MPKVGLNRNFPTAVFQGSAEYGGLAHPPLYTLKGYKQIQLLMGTIRKEDGTGKMMKASLAYEQQESGYVTPILHTISTTKYQRWAEATRVGTIKTFLHKMNAELHIEGQWCPTLQQENDVSLMESFQRK